MDRRMWYSTLTISATTRASPSRKKPAISSCIKCRGSWSAPVLRSISLLDPQRRTDGSLGGLLSSTCACSSTSSTALLRLLLHHPLCSLIMDSTSTPPSKHFLTCLDHCYARESAVALLLC
uniref:Uncharacterized protein n=1 Tax=Physcomitrium patens TaxID=3218 RepID=A0A7I4EYB8_PHYPA